MLPAADPDRYIYLFFRSHRKRTASQLSPWGGNKLIGSLRDLSLLVGAIMSNNVGSLSLQQKVSVTLLTVMVLLAFISYGILDAQVAPAFENLERKAAHTNVVRAQRAIGADLDNLVTVSND